MDYTFTIDDTAIALYGRTGQDLMKEIQIFIDAQIELGRRAAMLQAAADMCELELATQTDLMDQIAKAKEALPPIIEVKPPAIGSNIFGG